MRRKDREITDHAEILKVIGRCDVCSVAFADADVPYVVPMNFGMTEKNGRLTLWFHCANEGRKLEFLARNSRAAFAMSADHVLEWENSGHCTMRYESVCGSGVMRLASHEEKKMALDAIMDHYRPETAEKRPAQYPDALLREVTILKLEVEELTGKRSAPAK